MSKICTFVGHSKFVKCRLNFEKLKSTLEELINEGVDNFYIGTHGEFDTLCLNACVSLKEKYSHIAIFKVFSYISQILKEPKMKNIDNICFDIEHIHFKQKITKSKELMIDKSDIIICYVDEEITHSGAKNSLNYAKKKNKKIINLY